MSSPGAAPRGASASPPEPAGAGGGPATPPVVERLRRRRDFLAARAGERWVTPGFVVQAVPRAEGDRAEAIGLGFTVSRRVGKAVARNRARRRLREAARAVLPGPARPGFNYVIVARPAVLTCSFDRLLLDLSEAFARVVRKRTRSRPASGSSKEQSTSTDG